MTAPNLCYAVFTCFTPVSGQACASPPPPTHTHSTSPFHDSPPPPMFNGSSLKHSFLPLLPLLLTSLLLTSYPSPSSLPPSSLPPIPPPPPYLPPPYILSLPPPSLQTHMVALWSTLMLFQVAYVRRSCLAWALRSTGHLLVRPGDLPSP